MKSVRRAIGLFNWFKHKKRAVESIAQFAGSNSGAAQVGNHGCFAGYASVNTGLCSGRRQANVNDPRDMSEAGSQLKENNRPLIIVENDIGITKLHLPSHLISSVLANVPSAYDLSGQKWSLVMLSPRDRLKEVGEGFLWGLLIVFAAYGFWHFIDVVTGVAKC